MFCQFDRKYQFPHFANIRQNLATNRNLQFKLSRSWNQDHINTKINVLLRNPGSIVQNLSKQQQYSYRPEIDRHSLYCILSSIFCKIQPPTNSCLVLLTRKINKVKYAVISHAVSGLSPNWSWGLCWISVALGSHTFALIVKRCDSSSKSISWCGFCKFITPNWVNSTWPQRKTCYSERQNKGRGTRGLCNLNRILNCFTGRTMLDRINW